MKSQIADVLVKSLRESEKELTRLIQVDAARAGWPKNLVKSLRVKVNANDISVSYPDAFSSDIEDLEYGSREATPQPVFRKFIAKHTARMGNKLEEALSKELTKMEAML